MFLLFSASFCLKKKSRKITQRITRGPEWFFPYQSEPLLWLNQRCCGISWDWFIWKDFVQTNQCAWQLFYYTKSECLIRSSALFQPWHFWKPGHIIDIPKAQVLCNSRLLNTNLCTYVYYLSLKTCTYFAEHLWQFYRKILSI